MTKTQLKFLVPLIAVVSCVSLSVFALSDGEGQADDHRTASAVDVEAIHRHVERALAAVPWETIGHELADLRVTLDDLDMDEIHAEVEAALEEIDVEAIQAEVSESLADIDWEEIHREILEARSEIDAADLEAVQIEVQEALESIDWDEIRQTLEAAGGLAAEELEALEEALEALGGGSGVI